MNTQDQNGFPTEPAGRSADYRRDALAHLDALFGFAMTLTRNPAEAEDLVQETYLRAARAFDSLAPDSNLKSWLFAIMRNHWLNQARHVNAGPRFVEIDAAEPDMFQIADEWAPDPYASLLRKITQQQVRTAISRLPLQYREIIIMRDLEGLSYQQIAGILACPAGTVMSRLARARQQLKTLLEIWHTPDDQRPRPGGQA
ncbi:MAG: RNA polymerase sigma factor [Blastocatellia bacterium]